MANISFNNSVITENNSNLEEIQMVLFLSAFFINFFVDVLVMYAIRKLKKQRLHTHNLIFHLTLLDALNFAMFVIQYAFEKLGVDETLQNLSVDFQQILIFVSYLAYALLGVDWTLETYYPSWSTRFRKDRRVQIWCVYISVVVLSCALLLVPFRRFEFIISIRFAAIGCSVLCLSIVTILCIHWWKKRACTDTGSSKSSIGLKISATGALMSFPFYVVLMSGRYFGFLVHLVIEMIPIFTPVANVFILYRNDKDYREWFIQVVRCSFKSVQDLDSNGLIESTIAYESNGV